MAALALSTKAEQTESTDIKMKENVPQNADGNTDTVKFSAFDCAIVVLSMIAIFVDLCTDFILILEYIHLGHRAWALATFVLIFFPSLIVQTFSLRWHIVNKTADVLHWVLHICMLGLIHRYLMVVKAGLAARKSKNAAHFQRLYSDQSDLCILHLFESFLESAPQLVLQLYIIIALHEWKFWTGLSAAASLISLGWALAAYTRAQRCARLDKKKVTWPGLVLQAAWRVGMLTARISSLVLFAYCFGCWIFLLIGLHWMTMTMWIVYQNTDFCETVWEERIYNAVAGVIYCFCFFNLQEGQSRWRALTFYLIIIIQNLTCLTVFLMWFAGKTPKLAISAFVAVVGGTLIGVISMLLYYRFFHPAGPIKIFWSLDEAQSHDTSTTHNSGTMRSLKNIRQVADGNVSQESLPQSDTKHLLNNCRSPLSDSVVIIEENVLDDTDVDIKVLQSWIGDENKKLNVSETTAEIEKLSAAEPEMDNDAYKRRAICSSVDLVKLIETKEDKETETETDSNGSLKLVGMEEAPSEILSAHDYENLCAVNIAREAWGLRSWRGYSDIETWLHDDSVVHDGRRDTLTSTTTSSELSGNTLQKDNERTRQDDYLDTLVDDLAQCESETSSDGFLGQFSMDSLGTMYPMSTLDTILEELEESSASTDLTEIKNRRHGSASTLVATIDEIRLNTPVQNRYGSFERVWDDFSSSLDVLTFRKSDLEPEEILFLSKLRTIPEVCDSVAPRLTENLNLEVRNTSPKKEEKFVLKTTKPDNAELAKRSKSRPRRKFSLIRERFETKRTESTTDLFSSNERLDATPFERSTQSKIEVTDKENIPTVASKISHWDKILNAQNSKKTPEKIKPTTPIKRTSVKEKRNLFLKQVLTPPKFQSLRKKNIKTSTA